MNVKDFIIQQTRQSAKDVFKYARALPADKLEWKVQDTGRSALDMCQECAQAPLWMKAMLADRKVPDFNPEMYEDMVKQRSAWSLDEAERVCDENIAMIEREIRDFPDDHLEDTLILPFANNLVLSYAQIMLGTYWNNVYHIGQIAFIQTLLGDREMH